MDAKEVSDRYNATIVEKQFVRKYKQLPHLWNPHHPDYNNKFKRNAGYDSLLPIFRQCIPEATRLHVRQKINALRSCYRKERRKILASGRLDEDGNLVYTHKPNLWKYHALKFLDEEVDDEAEHNETGAETMEDEIEYVDSHYAESGNDEPDTSKLETPIYLEEDLLDDNLEDHKPFKRKRSQNSSSQSYLDLNYCYRESDVLEKEFNAIGANVACKLQRMTTQQRYRAELLINKVLIKGLKESLTETTDLTEMWNIQHEVLNNNHSDDTQHISIIKGDSKENSNNTSVELVYDLSEN